MNNFAIRCLGRSKLGFILVMGLFVCAACGGQPAPPTATASPENGAAAESLAAPTPADTAQLSEAEPSEVEPAATGAEAEESADVSQSAAQEDWTFFAAVEGDYFVRGNPAAPVRLIDYSDFL